LQNYPAKIEISKVAAPSTTAKKKKTGKEQNGSNNENTSGAGLVIIR